MHIYKKRVDVRDIFINCIKANEFNGYHIICSYLAIEEYYGYNNYGEALYQKAWESDTKSFVAPDKLKDIIVQYERIRNSEGIRVVLSEDLSIVKGLEYIALGLYHGDYFVLSEITEEKEKKIFDDFWLIENFENNDAFKIKERTEELIKESQSDFVAVFWPPVKDYFDEIIADINVYAKVTQYYDIKLSDSAFPSVIQMAYNIDDSTKDMIEKKINAIGKGEKIIRIAYIRFEQYEYRFKFVRPTCIDWVERKTVSTSVERLKSIIRKTYKNRINYYFDIIMHMGDNCYQNEFMRGFFEYLRDFDKENIRDSLLKQGVELNETWYDDEVLGKQLEITYNESTCLNSVEQILEENLDSLKKVECPLYILYSKEFNGYPAFRIKLVLHKES